MKAMTLEIITPVKKVFIGEVTLLTVPGSAGEFQVLYHHAPIMSSLEPGVIRLVTTGDEKKQYITGGGVVEVKENKIIILADSAETADEIDRKRAEDALERAKKRLSSRNADTDIKRAEMALARALNRLKQVR